MREKIIEMIEGLLALEKGSISENTLIEEVAEWDSLAHVLIIGQLEEKFGISIPLDQVIEIESVKDLFEKAGV